MKAQLKFELAFSDITVQNACIYATETPSHTLVAFTEACLVWSSWILWYINHCRLFNTKSLPIQVMTTGPLPGPSKCKSGRLNAWGHSSTHRTTLWRWWSGRPHHATSHLRSRLESQHQSVRGCAKEYSDPQMQSGARWQTMGVAAGHGAGPQVQRDPGLASEGVLRLCTLLSLPPPPTWTRWTTSFGHMSRTSPTWPPTTPKPAWSLPSAEYSLSSRRLL